MRKSILLYLFVFSLIIIVFQYANAKKMLASKDENIEVLEQDLALAEKKYENLYAENSALEDFSLLSNDSAMSYFENRGYYAAEVARRVREEIIDRNKASEDNELVPFDGMEGQMRINRIKILNHKWLLAEFTDGTYWGELFISYHLNENGELELETEEAFLYPGE